MFVKFMGANMHYSDDGTKSFTPRGPITINKSRVSAYYDNTIVMGEMLVRVMDDHDSIDKKLHPYVEVDYD